MTPEQARSIAEANFHQGYTCSQAVLCTFAETLGISKETAMKTALAFGGGMCRMREVCGTVSGMLMALGLLEGSGGVSSKDEKDTVYAGGQQLADQFRKDHGSIVCRELLGLVPLGTSQAALAAGKNRDLTQSSDVESMTSPISEARTDDYYKRRPCEKLCGDAAELFAHYLAKHK